MKVNDKLVLTEIKNTPFTHATDGEKNYIICGKVLLETEKNLKETKQYVETKPWELIAELAQATVYTIMKEMNKNN